MPTEDPWAWDLEATLECFERAALNDPTYDRQWWVDAEHADEFERALRVPYRRQPGTIRAADGQLVVVFHRLEFYLN